MRKKLLISVLMTALILAAMSSAHAVSNFVGYFGQTYAGTTVGSFGCNICHSGPPTLNSTYGTAIFNAGLRASSTLAQFQTASHSIDSADSDGDGFSNVAETTAVPSTNPAAASSHPTTPPPPAALSLSLNPSTLPTGTQGAAYSKSVTMSATGGTSPYSFTCSGSGVAGLTASSSGAACTVSGTPTASGTYTVSLKVTDSAAGSASGSISFSVTTSTPPPPPPPTTTDGVTLYMQYCSQCHGTIQKSEVRGESAADISRAIRRNTGGMGFLKSQLTAKQVNAIARALSGKTPPPPPTPPPSGEVHPTGWINLHPDFVDKNGTTSCRACHGADLQGGAGPSCNSCHGSD